MKSYLATQFSRSLGFRSSSQAASVQKSALVHWERQNNQANLNKLQILVRVS